MRQGPGEGAAGSVLGALQLTNTSAVTCTVYGYPGLQLLDARRHYLPTTVTRMDVASTTGPPTLVRLAPGGQAYARFVYSHVPVGTASPQTQCPVSGYVEVTPPDETDFLLLRASWDPCRGRVGVSPVRAGVAAQ